ncbi:DUF1934 domain-containing protein [Vagococcus xieshaowenii]|uniref:DUF1934 domain-containing protein n=1 Tax=Vagococcus xieshaowenii TaxID=2562451 RepID=A0AAJ5JLT5_9ENTE|nr:DUF1934 domain-containing protein [Vagococcus xieshaowenii]QCA29083.1 DUF1934 domain-containing protein [Vagococcus xieshaowenii]TFZ40941.1 DUF1934 domain-containing protein [Vagococcus xieshaowenii]
MTERNDLPISIQLRTEIFQNEQMDEHYFDVLGQFVQVGDNIYIRYQEPVNKNEAEAQPVNVTIKIEPDGTVHLIRADHQRMRLSFSYQKEFEANYHTPYGIIPIKTVTNNLRVTLMDKPISGNVLIDYELHAGEDKLGVYHLRLQFTA